MRRLSGVEMPIIPDLDIARAVAPVEAAVAELLRDLVHLVHLARLVVQLLLARAAPGHGLANWNSDSVHFFTSSIMLLVCWIFVEALVWTENIVTYTCRIWCSRSWVPCGGHTASTSAPPAPPQHSTWRSYLTISTSIFNIFRFLHYLCNCLLLALCHWL